jgi:hypothetical protein
MTNQNHAGASGNNDAFPLPAYFGRMRYWALSALEAYEARARGLQPPKARAADEEIYLNSKQVRARYGDLGSTTLERWIKNSAECKQGPKRRLTRRSGENRSAA